MNKFTHLLQLTSKEFLGKVEEEIRNNGFWLRIISEDSVVIETFVTPDSFNAITTFDFLLRENQIEFGVNRSEEKHKIIMTLNL